MAAYNKKSDLNNMNKWKNKVFRFSPPRFRAFFKIIMRIELHRSTVQTRRSTGAVVTERRERIWFRSTVRQKTGSRQAKRHWLHTWAAPVTKSTTLRDINIFRRISVGRSWMFVTLEGFLFIIFKKDGLVFLQREKVET